MRIILVTLIFFLAVVAVQAKTLRIDFSHGLNNWEEKVFKGRVDYRLIPEGGRQVLQAESRGRASALIYRVNIYTQKYTKLRWRWKIERILAKGQAGLKSGDDCPARLYLIFDSWLPNYARSINYIWASHVERDKVVVSPYYHRAVMLAVESGPAGAGEWVVEERDLRRDFERTFGGEMPLIRAVAVMSDGDNTGENSRAWYDWLEFAEASD